MPLGAKNWDVKIRNPQEQERNGTLLTKLFGPTVRKNRSSDREKNLKFEAEGREFEKKN